MKDEYLLGTPVNKGNTETEYGKFLNGKRVAVVGPAPNIIGSNQRELIDSFDIVVRINKAMPVPKDLWPDVGNRCDILYHCMDMHQNCGGPIDFNILNENGVSWIATPFANKGNTFGPLISGFNNINSGKFPFHCSDGKFYDSVVSIVGCRPNTGFLTIADLLRHNISQLYVTGFTFFRGGYNKYYRNGRSEAATIAAINAAGKHLVEPQIDFIRKIFKSDDRFLVDKCLNEILTEKDQ